MSLRSVAANSQGPCKTVLFELLALRVDWLNVTVWVSFTFCLSLTAGGLMVLFRNRVHTRIEAARELQYFLIFLYVFGFYGLWSDMFLPRFVDTDNLPTISAVVGTMGVPFFVISLIMQLSWANRVQRGARTWVVLATCLTAIGGVALLYTAGYSGDALTRAGAAQGGFIVCLGAAAILVSAGSQVLPAPWRWRLAGLVLAGGAVHLSYFTPVVDASAYPPLFAFVYFLTNTAVAVTYLYVAKPANDAASFDDVLTGYGITRRERDVVAGIYAGLTNKEIADRMSVTLQTVKDHTSRIYQKTQVKNRTQLAALLRDAASSD